MNSKLKFPSGQFYALNVFVNLSKENIFELKENFYFDFDMISAKLLDRLKLINYTIRT